MKLEKEITVEVDCGLEKLVEILINNNFELKEEYDLNDIYMINKNEKKDDFLSMLSKCVLIRKVMGNGRNRKLITYKYKEFDNHKDIIKQGKIDCEIDNVENMKLLLERLDFIELIRINDYMLIFANDEDEIAVQNVNGKHIYIEIEDKCNYIDKFYSSIDEMKEVIIKNSIPIKNNNYFVKKAEIELMETYNVNN